MRLKDFGIELYIPSTGRSMNVSTVDLFHEGDYKLVVRESEKAAYSKYDLVVFPDDEINSLSKVRQKIIDTSKGKLVLQCDDDLSVIAYKNKENYLEMTKDQIVQEIVRMFSIISDLRLGYWSVTPNADVRKYRAPVTFKGIAGGIVGFNKNYLKSRYDERLFTRTDIDLLLQETKNNRIAMIADYIMIKQKRDKNKGGNNSNKTSRIIGLADEIMKQKWGKYYEYDKEKNIPKILYKR